MRNIIVVKHAHWRLSRVAGLGLSSVCFVACGTTSTAPGNATTTVAHATTSVQATSTTRVTESTTSTSTTASPVSVTSVPAVSTTTNCHSSQLEFAANVQPMLADQQVSELFRYTNVSSAICTLLGYPGIEFLTSNGQAINTSTVRGGGYPTNFDPGPHLQTLAPGMSVYFYASWSSVPIPGVQDTCNMPVEVQSYAPNDYSPILIPTPFSSTYYWICDAVVPVRVTAVGPENSFLQTNNFFPVDFAADAYSS